MGMVYSPPKGARIQLSVLTLIVVSISGIEWLRGDCQSVSRWGPGHRLEAYATLACRRGCRWFADLLAGAFETSFHTPES
jgi:hypothetical protein